MFHSATLARLFVFLLAFLTLPACTVGQMGRALILADDLLPASWSESEWSSYRTYDRGSSNGPIIQMDNPIVALKDGQPFVRTQTPASLRVSFKSNRAPINPKSLEVKARKGILSVDLTNRLAPYIQKDVLEVKGLSIPRGYYIIEVSISDTQGNKSEVSYHVEVS